MYHAEMAAWPGRGTLRPWKEYQRDRPVGKLGATADRNAGVLRVNAVHRDADFTPAMTAAIDQEIDDLARRLGLALIRSR